MSVISNIKKLGRQLYPTGRAFRMREGGYFDKLNNVFALSEARMIEDGLSIFDSAIPDNDNFTTEDASQWETRLGLITNELVSLEDRKAAIRRKMAHPGNVYARQHYTYLEGQLRDAGFDVYVHENRFGNYADGFTTILPESLFPLEGDEIVTNGSFIVNSSWSFSAGSVSINTSTQCLRYSGASTGDYAEQSLSDGIFANSGTYRVRVYLNASIDKIRIELWDGGGSVRFYDEVFSGAGTTVTMTIDTTGWAGDGELLRIVDDGDGSGEVEYISIVPIIPFSTYPGLEENYYGVEFTNYVVNHIDPSREIFWDFGSNLRSTFFIGGQDLFDVTKQFADIDANRVQEFRQLILKIKPVQTKAFLLINEV